MKNLPIVLHLSSLTINRLIPSPRKPRLHRDLIYLHLSIPTFTLGLANYHSDVNLFRAYHLRSRVRVKRSLTKVMCQRYRNLLRLIPENLYLYLRRVSIVMSHLSNLDQATEPYQPILAQRILILFNKHQLMRLQEALETPVCIYRIYWVKLHSYLQSHLMRSER